jgi:hypothetical protein
MATKTIKSGGRAQEYADQILDYQRGSLRGGHENQGKPCVVREPQEGSEGASCDLAAVPPRESPADVVEHEMVLIGFGKRRAVFADARGAIDSFFN